MQLPQALSEDEILDLRNRLIVIEATLLDEAEQMKYFYREKISELYEEIEQKDATIQQIQQQISSLRCKNSQLIQQLNEKEALITQLSYAISSVQKKLKSSLQNNVDEGDFSFNKSSIYKKMEKSGFRNKRINISEYFMECIKNKIGLIEKQISMEGSTFSTLNPIPKINSTQSTKQKVSGSISKVKSLDSYKFQQYMTEFTNKQTPPKTSTYRQERKKKIQKYANLISEKKVKWKNISSFRNVKSQQNLFRNR